MSNFNKTIFEPGTLYFKCNICNEDCNCKIEELTRESPSCPACGSNVRMRAMINALSHAIFHESLAINDFPETSVVGKGMSDSDGYALPLSNKLNYCNTFYHKAPHLDITKISEDDFNSVDFLLSSDVFEHVNPPVSKAFSNARKMLKENGVFIFSVPYTLDQNTVEHFPGLHNYHITEKNGVKTLVNIDENGNKQEYKNLVYHGGVGETLELRIFSERDLLNELKLAGFTNITVMNAPCFKFGIYWWDNWSIPIIAK